MLNFTRRSFLLALPLAACDRGSEPVDPIWGKQPCKTCRMLVSEPSFAAQLLDEQGRRHYFDDIGCMDAYLVEHPNGSPRAMWVRSDSLWVPAESARYSSGAASPMAYGFVAEELGVLDFAAVRRGATAHRLERSR